MSGAAGKRASPEAGAEKSSAMEPPAGSSGTKVETIKLGSDASTEEVDIRTLQARNRKLSEVLDQRQSIEDELRDLIEKLVKRQATDDATLLILNRYWCQFDENLRIILQRWDAEQQPRDVPPEKKTPSQCDPEAEPEGGQDGERREDRERAPGEATLPFLALLASSTAEEMEQQLQERVRRSEEAVGRAMTAGERLREHVQGLAQRMGHADPSQREEALRELNSLLSRQNQRLVELTQFLQECHGKMSQEFSELQNRIEQADDRVSDMQTAIEDLQWDTDKIRKREQRLNRHLAEVLERVKSKGYKVYGGSSNLYGGTVTINARKFEEMNSDLEENKELAVNRLSELEKLQLDLQLVAEENMRLREELRSRASEVVRETPDFRCLQSQFSVLYNESLQVKAQLDEARSLLLATRSTHHRQIQQMGGDELGLQKKLRSEVMQLEDTLAQVRKEYEMLRIEFEQTLAANEQAGPINREMRHLISTLQTHNHQLKGDVQRYKRKQRDTHGELAKFRRKAWEAHSELGASRLRAPVASQAPPADPIKREPEDPPPSKRPRVAGGGGPAAAGAGAGAAEEEDAEGVEQDLAEAAGARARKLQEDAEERERERERRERERPREKGREKEAEKGKSDDGKRKEGEAVKQMRAELKRAQESQKEMKLLLDMYRSSPKEQRDKVQLMAAEKKAKSELEALKVRLRELEEKERLEGRRMADAEALHRMKVADEHMEVMLKKVALAKQVWRRGARRGGDSNHP
ncbi:E3 ubiquitin-protein ligase BRE1A-like [Mobula hypostoma]|uniref:E3 ubiquitin-protein ligase BRE1A-like n=1 Tax=Mobula hypostoma TaxID=723540 RepID=UPI002FC2E263